MGNGSTSFLPAYNNCFTDDLSRDSFTPEYWDSHSINQSFKISSIFTGVVLLLFLAVGLPSNLIVIYSIIRQHLYKEPTHILLLNLTISDFLFCLLVMPLTIIASFSGNYIFGDNDYVRCRVCQTGFIYTWLTLVSVYMLGLLSIDRFIYIKFALYYNRVITTRRLLAVVIVVWLATLTVSLLPVADFGEIRYAYIYSTCALIFTHSRTNFYYALLVIILGFVPVVIVVVCNIWIAFIIGRQIKRIYRRRKLLHDKEENHQRMRRTQLVLFRTFGAIILTNIILWTPLVVFAVLILLDLLNISSEDLVPLGWYVVVYLASILHAVLHPIIEVCLIPEVKKTFKSALICGCICGGESGKSKSSKFGSKNISPKSGIISESCTKLPCSSCCEDCFNMCSSAVLPEVR